MDRFGLSSVGDPVAGFGVGTANPYSPYAPNVPDAQTMIDQIIAQVNAQLAAAGIASPFAGVAPTGASDAGSMIREPMPHIPAELNRAAHDTGPASGGGWMAALERLRRAGAGGGSDGDRLMREAARAMHGGGRGASASANGGTITHGNIGPNTTLNLSADAGRATDRTRRRY